MRVFAHIALVAFFAGCAEVAYDEIISGESIVNENEIDLPNAAKSTPIATKPKQTKTKPTKSNVKSTKTTHSKSTNFKITPPTQKSAKSTKLLDSPTIQPIDSADSANVIDSQDSQNALDSPNVADSADFVDSQDLVDSANLTTQNPQNPQNPSDSRILNKTAPQVRAFFDASKLNQPLPQLQAQCDSHDLQKCEDLGRIYAVLEKKDLATTHYKKACSNGKGRIMSCFFNALIFANNGDNATASEYLGVISDDALSALKIDEVELMLSISEIALIKDKLKISCKNGESTSCNALLSVFKIRGELSEAKAFFSAQCKYAKRQNSAPCAILKAM